MKPATVTKLAKLFSISIGATAGSYLGFQLYTGDPDLYRDYLMPIIHRTCDGERSHRLALKLARLGLVPHVREDEPEIRDILKTRIFGLELNNPVGLAAGCDKNGDAILGFDHFGFGFIEIGSTTPDAQLGTVGPRVFRLEADRAIINRYGVNNHGHRVMVENLKDQAGKIRDRGVIVGVNLGKNLSHSDAAEDYILGLKRFNHLEVVRYFVINVSSPNNPGLGQIQNRKELSALLERVLRAKYTIDRESGHSVKPLLLKISPDLNEDQLRGIAEVISAYSKPDKDRSKVDGLIVSNATVQRPDLLRSPPEVIAEEGGLSGTPLKELSTRAIRRLYAWTGGSVPIIGVGGIESGDDAYKKITAGASAVQLFTSMAFFGPPIVRKVKRDLAEILIKNGYHSIEEAVGTDHKPSPYAHNLLIYDPPTEEELARKAERTEREREIVEVSTQNFDLIMSFNGFLIFLMDQTQSTTMGVLKKLFGK